MIEKEKSIFSKIKNFLSEWSWLLLLLIFSAIVVFYSLFRKDAIAYWDGALASLFATMIGVIVGVPVALALERNRDISAEKQIMIDKIKKQIKFARYLKEEIQSNIQYLNNRLASARPTSAFSLDFVPDEPLNITIWTIFTVNEDMNYIEESDARIAMFNAYRAINFINDLEKISRIFKYDTPAATMEGMAMAADSATRRNKKLYDLWEEAVQLNEKALKLIDELIIDKENYVGKLV